MTEDPLYLDFLDGFRVNRLANKYGITRQAVYVRIEKIKRKKMQVLKDAWRMRISKNVQ